MKYLSTRNSNLKITSAKAIASGLAPDGGLFVPEVLPSVTAEDISALCRMDYRGRAVSIMSRYLEDFSVEELREYCSKAYSSNYDTEHPAPLHILDDTTAYLELWHGPTCAFKDMALQMLPYLLTASLLKTGEEKKVCILVATSGDTGKAALEGFKDVDRTKIFVFYPVDGVSDIQKLQMITQEGENVGVCSVKGNFDDAQTGVKKIFGDKAFAEAIAEKGWFLSSANSINWGRLLPQIVYYFSAYCDMVNAGKISLGEKINFCVPTGNFGNILAGYYAKEMGLPVNRFICASNENNVLTDFFMSGKYDKNRAFHTTISPSMDILVSSNLERLLYKFCGDEKTKQYMTDLFGKGDYTIDSDVSAALREAFSAGCCDDAETKAEIKRVFDGYNYLIDTHTAVASKVLADYRKETGDNTPAVVVSTASPFKFAADVLSALGTDNAGDPLTALSAASGVAVPRPLSNLESRTVRFTGCVNPADMPSQVSGFIG